MNADDTVDQERRRFLITATSVVGGVGLVAAAVPFVSSMLPSTKAEAEGGPVTVDIAHLAVGAQMTVSWRGRPIWIIRRTPETLAKLASNNRWLRDPNSTVDQQPSYAKNLYRSIRPEILVLVGVCTHLGCIPLYRPIPGEVDTDWPGGFFCPCHGSKFDLSGRVFKEVPAPINLEVPVYSFVDEHTLLIGVEAAG